MTSRPHERPLDATCPRCFSAMEHDGWCVRCAFALALEPEDLEEELLASAPQRVGGYDLLEQIARGGMGVVWRARQRKLNREVALKFVLEGALPGETVARRFRQEAEVAAQLSHPHLISIYEVGEADGRYFISMELAEGGTLAQRLARSRFTPRAAAELMQKLAIALQYAHDHGVLHRDLKPGNILFDAAGEPRITDFGLARLGTSDQSLTLTGAVIGTPAYMSPEQATGQTKELTTASDVYSLGAVFYEMLAGRPAFGGDSPVEVLRQVLDLDPPRLPGGNRDLETICQTCLAKKPAERYRSAGALAEDLARWLAGEPIHASRATPAERAVKWARRHPLLAGLSFSLLVAAMIIAGLVVASQVRLAAARGAAEASARETLHRQADRHATVAVLALESGDWLRALPSLAEAIRIGTGDPLRDRINRLRFENILRLSPKLAQMWFPKQFSNERPWVPGQSAIMQLAGVEDRMVLCNNHLLRLLDVRTGLDAMPISHHENLLVHAALHPTLHRLIAETDAAQCEIVDAVTGGRLAQWPGRMQAARLLFPHGATQLALWTGQEARVYSLEILAPAGPVLTHPAAVEWAYLCANGRHVLTCAADQFLRVWDAGTGVLVGAPLRCDGRTRLLGEDPAAPGKGQVLVQMTEEAPRFVDVGRGAWGEKLAVRGDIRAVAWAEGRPHQAVATRDGFVVLEARTGEIAIAATPGVHGNDVEFSGDGGRVFTRGVNGASRLWSLVNGRPLTPVLWEGSDPRFCALDYLGNRILVSDQGPVIRLWEVRGQNGARAEIEVSTGGQALAWMEYKTLDFLKTVQPFHRPGAHGRPTLTCVLPYAHLLRVQDPATGRDSFPPLRHHAPVIDAVFSADGRRLASYAANQCAYLWDARTGEQIGPLLRHDRPVNHISFSPDGSLVATNSHLALRVWEAATGIPAGPPMLHRGVVHRVWWGDDSQSLFTVDRGGRQREWSMAPGQRPVADLQTLAQLYSAHRVTSRDALVLLTREETQAAWEAAKKIGAQ